jgi:hypothetical protein
MQGVPFVLWLSVLEFLSLLFNCWHCCCVGWNNGFRRSVGCLFCQRCCLLQSALLQGVPLVLWLSMLVLDELSLRELEQWCLFGRLVVESVGIVFCFSLRCGKGFHWLTSF